MPAFYLATLGCAKNIVDSAGARLAFLAQGWEETLHPKEADLLIVNTCGFITQAKEESIETMLELSAQRKPGAHLVMAGCFAERNAAELRAALPEADAFIGIHFAEALAKNPFAKGIHPAQTYHPVFGASAEAEPGAAWLKLSDGCDNGCSYCAIPMIRGAFRARAHTAITEEARLLAAKGIRELNLIAQDSARYADPNDPSYTLPRLLDDLEEIDGIRWIRILYLHPASLREDLIERMLVGGKVLPYFDIPVQALVDATLRRMRRRVNYAHIRALVTHIRSQNPDAILRTTLITGYPGETSVDHRETLQKMRELAFDKLGCFIYSREEGTDAAREAGQVSQRTKAGRYDAIMRLQQGISAERLKRFVGQTLEVLVSETKPSLSGRSYQDSPDVDGMISFTKTARQSAVRAGDMVQVRITASGAYDLSGELV
ncbi:MAG: 30S ribosomal protein S12 methylthiotransferase RimO [Spirochaetota bacterium]|nr:30S ribosomal protein S12 methylthiotransferase RimO [Spirochaetota bacterium]